MHKTSYRGFTLIELMVTVVIIAIFAMIAIPSYQYFVAKAQRSQAQAEMMKLAERLENYRGRQLTYAGYIPENQNSGAKGIVNIPYGSSSTTYDYQIKIVDINDTSKSLQDSALGQGWRMVATANQSKTAALRSMGSLLTDSRGTQCMTSDSLTISSTNCGTNSKGW